MSESEHDNTYQPSEQEDVSVQSVSMTVSESETESETESEYDSEGEIEPYEELTDSWLEMRNLLNDAGLCKRISAREFCKWVNSNSSGKRILCAEFRSNGRLAYFYVDEEL